MLLGAIGRACLIHHATDFAQAVVDTMPYAPKAIKGISSLGAWGSQGSHRGIGLRRYNFQIEPYDLILDASEANTNTLLQNKIPVLIPFKIMHALYLAGPEQFQLSLIGRWPTRD